MPQKTQQLQNGTNAVYKGSGELVQGIGLLEKQMIPQIEKSVDQVNKNIQESGSQVFDSVKQGADQLKNSTDQLIASIQAATGETTGGKSSGLGQTLASAAQKARAQASDCTGGSRSGGSSRKYRRILFKRFLTEAVASGDMEAVKEVHRRRYLLQRKMRRRRRKREIVYRQLRERFRAAVMPCTKWRPADSGFRASSRTRRDRFAISTGNGKRDQRSYQTLRRIGRDVFTDRKWQRTVSDRCRQRNGAVKRGNQHPDGRKCK